MAYIDKILWYDQHDRYIPIENQEEGWVWGFEKASVRHRASKNKGDLVSIELWGEDGDAQEVLLTKQNAMRLADTLKMAVVEFTVEEMMERNNRYIEDINNKMNWLEPVIEKEIKAWKEGRKNEKDASSTARGTEG